MPKVIENFVKPTQLFFPLDFPNLNEAQSYVDQLSDLSIGYKIGFQLFYSEGERAVRAIREQGHPVFLDLKLYDIPNTVAKGVESLIGLDIDFLTIHISGGRKMIENAIDVVQSKGSKTTLLGVSALTSFSQEGWSEVCEATSGTSQNIHDSVLKMVDSASSWGLNGFVCSPLELEDIRKKHSGVFLMTPGVRPEGSNQDDQSRTMTPKEAHLSGASAIVMGRPIARAKNPRQFVQDVLKDLGHE